MASLELMLSTGGLKEVGSSVSSSGVELPKQNLGTVPRG